MSTEEKINYIVDSYNTLRMKGVVRTQGEFAALLGIGERSLSAAKNGKDGYLTDSLLARIRTYMESYQDSETKTEGLPVIPVEAMAGTLVEFFASVKNYDCERMISPIKGAEYAIKIFGDSMSPEYPSGSVCLIKQVNERQFIEWGKVYVLDTDNGAVIKKVRRTDKENVVECVSINPNYQPFTIDTTYIHGWYRVLMVMSIK